MRDRHGADSPTGGDFEANEAHCAERMIGPRMVSYGELAQRVVCPDAGALVRRLDDGGNHADGEPGIVYVHLGGDEAERRARLAVFKAWVGRGAWRVKRWSEIDKHELDRVRAAAAA